MTINRIITAVTNFKLKLAPCDQCGKRWTQKRMTLRLQLYCKACAATKTQVTSWID